MSEGGRASGPAGSLAEVVVNAVCESLSRLASQANQDDGTPLIGSTAPVTNTGSAQNRPSPYQRAVQLQTPSRESGVETSGSSRSTSTRRFQQPSMF